VCGVLGEEDIADVELLAHAEDVGREMCGQVVANDDLDVLPGQRLDMAQENLMKGS
jgi:hypothetical protein